MVMKFANHYARLGLPKDATPEEIRKAYRQAALRLHPDTNPNPEAAELFIAVQKAYEVLSDVQKRSAYDDSLPPGFTIPPALTISTLFSRTTIPKIAEPQLIYILVEMAAQPDAEIPTGPPLNVCLVLDCSTSMHGQTMDMVKSTAVELVRQLRPQDMLSIVTFSDRAEVLVPSGNRMERSEVETSIRMLQTFGGTEILHGLELGLAEVKRHHSANNINHIILLTDGRTYGDEEACVQLAEQAALLGIGISGLGIGGKYNDVFLDKLASKTGGTSKYVAKSKDIRQFLKDKFSGLGQGYADNILYHFETGPGITLRYAFRLQPDASPLELEAPIHLGSLQREGNLSFLMELLVTSAAPDAVKISLLEGRLSMDIPSRETPTYTMRLNLERVASNEPDSVPPPPTLVHAMSRLNLYRMQERAQKDVNDGDIQSATRRLQQVATSLLAQGQHELASTVLKEAVYLQKSQTFSEEGDKRIKYGTRSLLLPQSIKG